MKKRLDVTKRNLENNPMKSIKARLKSSKSHKLLYKDKTKHNRYGKHNTEEHKRKMVETKRRNGTLKHTEKTKIKMSKTKKKLAKEGKIPTIFKIGQVPWNKKTKTKKICNFCKKEFFVHPYYTSAKYCSKNCYSKSLIGRPPEQHGSWRGGLSFEPYGLEFNSKLKEFIRKRDNLTCQECGFTQNQLGYKLPVHHIDFNKKNNNPDNLICLCRQCHPQTNFNREDWTKYFQEKISCMEPLE